MCIFQAIYVILFTYSVDFVCTLKFNFLVFYYHHYDPIVPTVFPIYIGWNIRNFNEIVIIKIIQLDSIQINYFGNISIVVSSSDN